MSNKDIKELVSAYRVERIDDPSAFYNKHGKELAAVGADAFGQPLRAFSPQVAERFEKAAFAHVMYERDSSGVDNVVGFGLFDTLRECHWQPAVDRG